MRILVPLAILAILGCSGIIPDEPSEKDTSENNGGGGSGNDRDGDGTPDATDCDPDDPNTNPDAEEVCNGFDDNCDGETDEGYDSTWYADDDNDGYGAGEAKTACEQPEGYVEENGDCDDGDKKYNPGADETCTDEKDYNCDGSVAYEDNDNDGWAACEDCNDDDKSVHTSTSETCNNKDDDCDGKVDDNASDCVDMYQDDDGDGYGGDREVCGCEGTDGYSTRTGDCDDDDAAVSPGVRETCATTYDDDCDGKTNDYTGGSAPVANAGRDTSVGGDTVDCVESGYGYECDSCARQTDSLSGSATDADGDTMTYKWTVSPSGPSIDSSTSATTDVTFPEFAAEEPGACAEEDYTFTLTVTDCSGESDTDTVVYTLSCCGR